MIQRRFDIRIVPCDRGDEAIALAGQCLDELRVLGGVTQSIPQVIHRLVETSIEVDERVGGPEPPRQFFARDELARTLEERKQ